MSKRAINADEGEFTVIDTDATAGPRKDVSRFELVGASVQATMTGGSYLLQGSNDGSGWTDVGGGAITASGLITLSVNVRYLRIFTTTQDDGVFELFAHELLY